VIQEHHQTRKAVGLFDVSHMGRFFFYGTDVGQWIDGLMTRRIAGVDAGKIRYSLVTNENGMILDDVLVYHLECHPDDASSFGPSQNNGDSFYMVVVNAGNREKLASWFQSHIPEGSDIRLEDRTESSAMIAVQGPLANGIMAKMSSLDPESLAYYSGAVGKVDDQWTIVTADDSNSAHFEHTIAITKEGPVRLTGPPSDEELESMPEWLQDKSQWVLW